jgi:hypothetical protein
MARPIELLRSQYLRDLSDEDAAGSTTEAVVGVGQALAGSGEGASVHGFVVGCFASLC